MNTNYSGCNSQNFSMICAILIALITSSFSFAQNTNDTRWKQKNEERMHYKQKGMMSFLKPLRRLDLSEQQLIEIKAVLNTHRDNTDEQRNRLTNLKGELTQLIPNFNETTAQGLALEIGEIAGQLEYAKIELRASIYKTLTSEQREKLMALAVFGKD